MSNITTLLPPPKTLIFIYEAVWGLGRRPGDERGPWVTGLSREGGFRGPVCGDWTGEETRMGLGRVLCTISNQQLLVRTNQESIETIITRRCWRWIGHIMRKEQDNITRTALHWTPEGKRKRGQLKNKKPGVAQWRKNWKPWGRPGAVFTRILGLKVGPKWWIEE